MLFEISFLLSKRKKSHWAVVFSTPVYFPKIWFFYSLYSFDFNEIIFEVKVAELDLRPLIINAKSFVKEAGIVSVTC